MPETAAVARYHPALVALHWIIAVLLVAMLLIGLVVLDEMPNTDPGKVAILAIHMLTGIGILALIAIRFFVRLRTDRPPAATSGYPLLDRFAVFVHYGFYVVVVAMIATGLATAIAAGLPAIVFGNSGDPLPADFDAFPTFRAHEIIANVLIALIVVHFGAALYHQFVRRDGLLGRMWFGSRQA
jgi:cytochrome b561